LNVWEEWAAERAALVTCEPEIALERFKVGDLEVLGHEVPDVGEECGGGAAVGGWEGVPIGGEGWRVPLGG